MLVRRTVRQLLQEKGSTVWSVEPSASVFDALQQMADRNVGALLVVADAQPVGIFSERDYARKVILHGRASRDMAVGDIMTRDLVTVTPEASLSECMQVMTDRRIRHLPVLEEGALRGIVSIGDVVKDVMAEQEFLIQQLQDYIGGGVV